MHTGSCQCGKVTVTYRGEIEEVSMCHCRQCQKAQGSAFAAVSPLDDTLLDIAGSENVREYESSPGKVRAFCGTCGSPIYSAKKDLPGIKRLRVGILDGPVTPEILYHKYVGSKADWFDIGNSLPQYRDDSN